jgi:HSP20 family protein
MTPKTHFHEKNRRWNMSTQTLTKEAHSPAASEGLRAGTRWYVPAVDITETDEELLLVAELPGVKPEDLDIQYQGGELSITGQVTPSYPPNARFLLSEYAAGGYSRSFELGETIDSARISAEHKDGVLTLRLPKIEAVKPRRITVKAG